MKQIFINVYSYNFECDNQIQYWKWLPITKYNDPSFLPYLFS